MISKIVKAHHAGFCYGVKRAVRLAQRLRHEHGSILYTLGPLIHNPQEVQRLSKLGIVPRETIEECQGRRTLVRTHGISQEEWIRAKELGIELVEATCPHVKEAQKQVGLLGEKNRTVLVIGDPDHPEVRALISYGKGPVVVYKTGGFEPLSKEVPIGIISQTTQSSRIFENVVGKARSFFLDVVAVNTLCNDTKERQEEGMRLALQVDLMVVVGGRNSANTCRLTEICRECQPKTIQVETSNEIEKVSLKGISKVGVTSGASTPDWLIAEVIQRLEEKKNTLRRSRKVLAEPL